MTSKPGTADKLTWQAEFHDADRETLFRRVMQPHDAFQMRYALGLTAGLFLAFSLIDSSVSGSDDALPALLAMRLTVVISCGLLALATWKRPSLAQQALPINLLCLLAISGLLVAIPLRPDTTMTQLASMVVASIALFLFLPNRLPWMLAHNAYLAIGFVITTQIWSPLPLGLLVTSLLLLGFVNLLGSLTVFRVHRLQREQFSLLLEERDANRRLKAEIKERKKLEEQLRHMATVDELTGIANRRHFFALAERELSRSQREKLPLALCMVDIDLFKQLNDRFGHAIGDMALRAVATCCQSVLRDTDIIGRYGGEEFVIALPQADLDTAAAIAERLRNKVSELALPELSQVDRLSVTVGISRVEYGEKSLDPALQRADQALYEGKAYGRNCIVVAQNGPALAVVKA